MINELSSPDAAQQNMGYLAEQYTHQADARPLVDGAPLSSSAPSASSAVNSPLFSHPDCPRFAALPDAVRRDVRDRIFAFKDIHDALQVDASRRLSLSSLLRIQAKHLGLTFPHCRRLWYAYLKSGGDWTTLVNKAKAGPGWWKTSQTIGLPRAFISYWRQLCEDNQRCDSGAYAELLHRYKYRTTTTGKPISGFPGYSQIANSSFPPPDPITGLPRGWSYENLCRYSPSKADKSAARQGRAAAAQFRRQVLTTRVGLQVGQFILFDDQEYDLKINFLGHGSAQRKAMRPLGLNALDLFSACSFACGFKPTLVDDTTGAKQKLKELDMMWFVVHVLTAYGFNPSCGTTIVVEHGTAAIRSDFEQRILAVTQGKVTVARSGIGGAPSFDGLFEGAAKGNFRFKAPLESFFNLVRNRFAALPGQVGKDRDHCPEELHGRDRYNTWLLKAMDTLPQDAAALLVLPFLTWTQFLELAPRLYQLINARTDHSLEGWEKAGLIAHEWRITPDSNWEPMSHFLALPAPQQMSLTELFKGQGGSLLTRSRQLSPLEVFNAGAKRLQLVRNHALPELLGLDLARRAKRIDDSGYLTIEDQELDPEPIRYHISDLQFSSSASSCPSGSDSSAVNSLSRNTRVNVYLNPYDPRRTIVLADDKNRYLGELTPQPMPSRADLDSIHRQIGAARKEESERLRAVGLRHIDRAQEQRDMHRHNASILSQHGPGANQPSAKAAQRKMDRAYDDALAENIRIAETETETPINPHKEYL